MATKSLTDNLIVEIRTTELGTPTVQLVQSYARVVLGPDDVEVSDDASVPTVVVFPSPIYLERDVTYALVLLAPTTDDYTAWIARMGEGNIAAGASGLADEGVSDLLMMIKQHRKLVMMLVKMLKLLLQIKMLLLLLVVRLSSLSSI